ncbi:MAG: tRNA lysidine(34) synthetase TilS [Kurthia sp.]|nr:tRNA lysidine(34) synthetase TilS [Candidatus Kurthia equi]
MIKLEQEAKHYIEKFQLIEQGDRIVVGCSGGVDSIVLLHFLSEFSKVMDFEVAAIHVNHMLRGEEADEDRKFVEKFCMERKIPLFAQDIPIPEIMEREQGNLQDVCRRERYAYCMQVMELNDYNKLAVAHHADDQMESILMALVKGANEQGILGMPAKRSFYSKELIRPLLSVTRQEIEMYLHHFQLTFREDASNHKDSYMRNRLRHHVVPLLREENTKVAKAFQRFSEKQRMEDELLDELAQKVLDECIIFQNETLVKLQIIPFQKHALALQRRAILLLLKYLYKDTIIAQSYPLWNAILSLVKTTAGHGEISLSDGGIARRQYDILELYRKAPDVDIQQTHILQKNTWISLKNGYRIGLFVAPLPLEVSTSAQYYTIDVSSLPLMLRARKNGDRMRLVGMTNNKKVSRILIDAKIPQQSREKWPVLVDANNCILSIPGLRNSHFLRNDLRLIDGTVLIIDLEE